MVDKAAEKYSRALYQYQISWLAGIGIDGVFIEVFWILKSFLDFEIISCSYKIVKNFPFLGKFFLKRLFRVDDD